MPSTNQFQVVTDNVSNVLAIQDFFINNLNKGVILCKLKKTMRPKRKQTMDLDNSEHADSSLLDNERKKSSSFLKTFN